MDFAAHWNRVLQSSKNPATDIITSLSEDSINRYLAKHHEHDTTKYTFKFEKVFQLQPERRVKVEIKVDSPLAVDLPPFQALTPPFTQLFGNNGWIDVDENDVSGTLPSASPFLKAQNNAGIPVSIRIFCRQLKFTLSWSKLSNPTQFWHWTPPPIAVAAEAKLELYQESERWFVKMMPTRIKFDKADPPTLRLLAVSAFRAMTKAQREALDNSEEKFYDLLLIGLNVIGTEYAPKMVKNIEIPVTTINEKKISPSIFNCSENHLTIGAALDTVALVNEAETILEREFSKLRTYIEDDIEAKGGMDAMMLHPDSRRAQSPRELVFRPRPEVERDFIRTNAYLKRLAVQAKNLGMPRAPGSAKRVRNKVNEGLAAGVNEYFFETLVNGRLPAPRSECSDWKSILSKVRGRTCHWSDIHGFDLAINGVQLTGSINIRIGGALEGCVRKFWDCSWQWACTRISLSVKGTPSITLRLVKDDDGVAFYGQLGGTLDLETNLPFPFDAIVRFFFTIIRSFVIAFANLILSFIKFRILIKTIEIPDQRTKLKLSDFTPFPFNRSQPGAFPPERLKFIGYKADVDAGR